VAYACMVLMSGMKDWLIDFSKLAQPSCCGNRITRNLVLFGLRLRKLEVIQDEIEAIFLCIQDCALEKFPGRK